MRETISVGAELATVATMHAPLSCDGMAPRLSYKLALSFIPLLGKPAALRSEGWLGRMVLVGEFHIK